MKPLNPQRPKTLKPLQLTTLRQTLKNEARSLEEHLTKSLAKYFEVKTESRKLLQTPPHHPECRVGKKLMSCRAGVLKVWANIIQALHEYHQHPTWPVCVCQELQHNCNCQWLPSWGLHCTDLGLCPMTVLDSSFKLVPLRPSNVCPHKHKHFDLLGQCACTNARMPTDTRYRPVAHKQTLIQHFLNCASYLQKKMRLS